MEEEDRRSCGPAGRRGSSGHRLRRGRRRGCGVPDQGDEALGLLLSREDTFLSELKADIEAEAAAQGYAVQYYNAGNDPETQLRQVHEALAEGVETLLVNLADGEDLRKGGRHRGRRRGRAAEPGAGDGDPERADGVCGHGRGRSGALQGHALAEYF